MVNSTQANIAATSGGNEESLTTFPGDLYVKNVYKSFGVTKALDGVSFTGHFGEIHAIIGGNGSGKSTLAKVLAGVLPIDSGKVSVNGHHPTTPGESRSIGVAMVFQEVLVADESSVVDNLFVGADGFFSKSMSDKEKQQKAQTLMSELAGEDVDPLQPAGTLPLNIKAWITIARGLLCEPDLLILDEASAALDFDSTERLFHKMREMRDKGVAIIIVTHRIAELIRISDRCTVMRDGKDVGVLEKQDITEENLLRLMTGGKKSSTPQLGDANKSTSEKVAIQTTGLKVWPDSAPVNFSLKKGEIVGITGLDGHGQDDFVRILAGVKTAEHGHPEVSANHGQEMHKVRSLAQAKENKIGFVSGDRKAEGILPNLSIFENLLFGLYSRNVKIAGLRIIHWLGLRDIFDWEVERLAIKTGAEENLITSLSGGNQQKVMLGRAFAQHPTSLMLLDPARGIDLHTKRDLYQQLREFASDGGSAVYMSSELEEFIGFCSRVLVFRNGSIFEEFVDEKVSGVSILESMFGRYQGDQNNAVPSNVTLIAPNQKPTIDNNGGDPVSDSTISDYFRPKNSKSAEGPIDSDYSNVDEVLFGQLTDHHEQNMSLLAQPEETLDPSRQEQSYSNQDNGQFDELLKNTSNALAGKRFVPVGMDQGQGQDYNSGDEEGFAQLLNQTIENQDSKLKTQPDVNNKKSQTQVQNSIFNDKDLDQFKQLMVD
ncbi:sugar ABC transporter ATP-binding protein [Candidatus Njordibacter sp. Uisw_039]|uniref:sugar ABC transporter ATP-binding protein n=1 Tax=Candidatus Njordibacter sp. Uisw_039 TaxID=3230972 RepID=UPI003D40D24A